MIKAGDAEGLGQALKTLVGLPWEAKQALGLRGRQLVLERFSIDQMAASTFKLYGDDFSARARVCEDTELPDD